MLDDGFNAYFDRYRRDAILLHKPYPPHRAPQTNSKFGGLPRLPLDFSWPIDENGTPLHFLAQIDCSDLKIASALPDTGVLFFFARDDEEQLWDGDAPKHSAVVIYAPNANAAIPIREHPADLPPIQGSYYKAKAWQNLFLEDEAGPCVHVEWPIQPLVIDTWPDSLWDEAFEDLATTNWVTRLTQALASKSSKSMRIEAQDENQRRIAYHECLEARRIDAFVRATGAPIPEANRATMVRDIARQIFQHAEAGPEAFPHFWCQIDYAARAFIGSFGRDLTHHTFDEMQLPRARDWIREAQAVGGATAVDDADKAAFRAWLMTLHKPRVGVHSPSLTPYDTCVFQAVRLNIRSWAGDPANSASIAPFIFAVMEPVLDSGWGLQYSQMLGHAPSAQEPLHPDDPTICLLNLTSDSTLGWMFGDVGNATFYISPDALANHDFSQIEAAVVGH